jgi:hypothetical protein
MGWKTRLGFGGFCLLLVERRWSGMYDLAVVYALSGRGWSICRHRRVQCTVDELLVFRNTVFP